MRSQRGTATKLGLVTLLVLSVAAQVNAESITLFTSAYHFRWNIGPNSVGLPAGDQQFVGVLDVTPTAGTTVTATQGAVTRAIPFTPFTVFPTMFRSLQPFDPALAGTWSLTATNGPDSAGPLVTPSIANPRLLPFAQNLERVVTGSTTMVTWSFPDLTGINLSFLRFRVYNDASNDVILNEVLPPTTTAFTIPYGLLVPGVSYVFSVNLQDTDGNVSTAFEFAGLDPHVLLVSSEHTDSVKRYSQTGAYLGEFVSAGIDGQVEPRCLTFGPDGNLYVGGGGDGNSNVRRFDGRTGAFLDTVTSGHPSRIDDLTFGPDGSLYGAVFEDDSVFRVHVTTGTQVGEAGPGSPLDGPRGVAFGADGHLYVGSVHTGEVLRFATTGAYIDVFATVPSGGAINGVTFGPDGDLYVTVDYCGPAGCLASDVLRFDGSTGDSKGSFIAPSDPHPVEPRSPVFGPDGDLYVSSYATDQVLRYDGTTGAFLVSFIVGGNLDGPSGIAFVPRPPVAPNDLLVASRANGRVIHYDASGVLLEAFVTSGSGGLESPTGMTYGPDGKLYVANGLKPDGTAPSANMVLRYDGVSGDFLDVFSSGFPAPLTGIAFGPDANLYGSVTTANFVFRADRTTGAWSVFAGPGSPLNFATGVTFGADGNLYVGSFLGNQVLRFEGTTGAYMDVFASVPMAGDLGRVGGLTFGPDGDLYVALPAEGNDIWRFDGTTGASKGSFITQSDPHPDGPMFMIFGPENKLYVSARDTDEVLRYDATTGAFIDHFAAGGGLDNATGIALPEPGVLTQIGAGLAALVALARRRHRGSRRQTLPRA